MSTSAPALKVRIINTPTADKATLVTAEEKSHPTSSSEEKTRRIAIPPSENGIRTVNVEQVRSIFAAQNFLRLCDTTLLADAWVQPISIDPTTTMYATVTFLVLLNGPKIQLFMMKTKLSLDDLLKMLYLNDCIQADFQGLVRLDFGGWLNEKTSAYVKVQGAENATNRSLLANYIVTQDKEFSFYPSFMKNCAMFFRKVSHHRYTDKEGKSGDITNASMIECTAAPRGKFNYVLEARCFPVPDKWWEYINEVTKKEAAELDVPETQPMELN